MRALFREAARDIVARDREARKGGRTQNTIGEIERAMVKAYVCGQEALLNKREGLLLRPMLWSTGWKFPLGQGRR